MRKTIMLIPTMFLLPMIGSGCFLQPLESKETRYNFIDYDAPAVRLAEPVNARILIKSNGEWVDGGRGELPAGAYVKGRKPPESLER